MYPAVPLSLLHFLLHAQWMLPSANDALQPRAAGAPPPPFLLSHSSRTTTRPRAAAHLPSLPSPGAADHARQHARQQHGAASALSPALAAACAISARAPPGRARSNARRRRARRAGGMRTGHAPIGQSQRVMTVGAQSLEPIIAPRATLRQCRAVRADSRLALPGAPYDAPDERRHCTSTAVPSSACVNVVHMTGIHPFQACAIRQTCPRMHNISRRQFCQLGQ